MTKEPLDVFDTDPNPKCRRTPAHIARSKALPSRPSKLAPLPGYPEAAFHALSPHRRLCHRHVLSDIALPFNAVRPPRADVIMEICEPLKRPRARFKAPSQSHAHHAKAARQVGHTRPAEPFLGPLRSSAPLRGNYVKLNGHAHPNIGATRDDVDTARSSTCQRRQHAVVNTPSSTRRRQHASLVRPSSTGAVTLDSSPVA